MSDTIEVFISYSKQDKELRDRLLAHLRPLEREGIITWHDRQILPGTEWDEEIKARLNAADIILLLISADFLATDYCTRVEIPEALRRHEAGEATVMPVILRSCGWNYTPLAKIQAYPEKAKPIVSWTYIDDAYTNVLDGVYLAATKIKEQRSQQQAEQERIQQEQQQSEDQERLPQTEQSRQQQAPEASKGDYAQLEALLKAEKWKEADEETVKQMDQVVGRDAWKSITQFPCAELQTIDQLWVKYSNGKFGFSVQKKIWQQCGCPTELDKQWDEFREAVGWLTKETVSNRWHRPITEEREVNYEDLTFDISAPEGHLPRGNCGCNMGLCLFGGINLLLRAKACGLQHLKTSDIPKDL